MSDIEYTRIYPIKEGYALLKGSDIDYLELTVYYRDDKGMTYHDTEHSILMIERLKIRFGNRHHEDDFWNYIEEKDDGAQDPILGYAVGYTLSNLLYSNNNVMIKDLLDILKTIDLDLYIKLDNYAKEENNDE